VTAALTPTSPPPDPGAEQRKPRFYSALRGRDDRELDWLADLSLAQEVGLLRVRLQDMLTDPHADWRLTLRSLEVLERIVRTQRNLPPDEGADPFAGLREMLQRLFGRDPDEEGGERWRPEVAEEGGDQQRFTPLDLG
jgi:hypothetical protein